MIIHKYIKNNYYNNNIYLYLMPRNYSNGKKQKTGIYFTNIHQKKQPNSVFKPGTEVYNIKTGLKGILIEKTLFKSKRSLSRVKYIDNKVQYITNNLLRTLNFFSDTQKNMLKTNNIQKRNKKNKEHTFIEKNKLFRQKRKEINDKLLCEFNLKYTKLQKHNKSIDYKIKELYKQINNLDNTKENYKNKLLKLQNEIRISKNYYKLLPCMLTQDGSTRNLVPNVYNNTLFIEYINNYGKKKDKVELENKCNIDNIDDEYEIIQTYDQEINKKSKKDLKKEEYKMNRFRWGLN